MTQKLLRIWIIVCLFLSFGYLQPRAQNLGLQAGRNFETTSQRAGVNGSSGLGNQRSVGANGKPCVALETYAKSQILNKRIFEHWVKAKNDCGKNIKLQVCYHKTNDCIDMTVPPWESKNAVLGIYPLKDFEYDVKEK